MNPAPFARRHFLGTTSLGVRGDGGTLVLKGNVKLQLSLRLVGQDSVVTKSEILYGEKSPISMMPEGLLKTLKDDEVRDLIAYLRTTAQVPLHKE